MEVTPAATRSVAGPTTQPTGAPAGIGTTRVHVQSLALVGFPLREQAIVIGAFRSELTALMAAGEPNRRSESEGWGKISVDETRPDAIGRAAARELARRLQK